MTLFFARNLPLIAFWFHMLVGAPKSKKKRKKCIYHSKIFQKKKVKIGQILCNFTSNDPLFWSVSQWLFFARNLSLIALWFHMLVGAPSRFYMSAPPKKKLLSSIWKFTILQFTARVRKINKQWGAAWVVDGWVHKQCVSNAFGDLHLKTHYTSKY